MRPGLRRARRRAGHFWGQPIHIPKVGQNALEFDPPAFCRDKAPGRSHPPVQPSYTEVTASPPPEDILCRGWEALPRGALRLRVAWGMERQRYWAGSLGDLAWQGPRSPATFRYPEGLTAQSCRAGGRCSTAPTAPLTGPHPVSSRRSAKNWPHVHRRLVALLEEKPGLPASPRGFSREGVRARLPQHGLLLSLRSGSVSIRQRPWGGKQLQVAEYAPTTLTEDGWQEPSAYPTHGGAPLQHIAEGLQSPPHPLLSPGNRTR